MKPIFHQLKQQQQNVWNTTLQAVYIMVIVNTHYDRDINKCGTHMYHTITYVAKKQCKPESGNKNMGIAVTDLI